VGNLGFGKGEEVIVRYGAVESYLIGRSGSEKLHRFKGEWSPKIAKDLYCLLSKKRIE